MQNLTLAVLLLLCASRVGGSSPVWAGPGGGPQLSNRGQLNGPGGDATNLSVSVAYACNVPAGFQFGGIPANACIDAEGIIYTQFVPYNPEYTQPPVFCAFGAGGTVWQADVPGFGAPDGASSMHLSSQGLLYTAVEGNPGQALVAFNASTGVQVWNYSVPIGFSPLSSLRLSSNGRWLYAVATSNPSPWVTWDALTGAVVNQFTLPPRATTNVPTTFHPTLAVSYTTSTSQALGMLAMNLTDGSIVWNVSNIPTVCQPLVSEDGTTLVAIAAVTTGIDALTGTVLWTNKIPLQVIVYAAGCAFASGTAFAIMFGPNGGTGVYLYAIDAASGAVVASTQLPEDYAYNVGISASWSVAVSADGSMLYYAPFRPTDSGKDTWVVGVMLDRSQPNNATLTVAFELNTALTFGKVMVGPLAGQLTFVGGPNVTVYNGTSGARVLE